LDAADKIVVLSERFRGRNKELRARKWQRIQKEATEVAEFLTNINKIFGKPAAVEVDIHGELVLQQGEFQPERKNLRYTRPKGYK
jgi:hypothetical protein